MIENRIINGSFETGSLAPFTGVNATISSPTSHTGSFSALLTGGTANSFILQFVPVLPSENFELFVSLTKIGSAISPPISITVGYYNGSSFLGYGLITNIPSGHLPDNNENDWTEIYQTTSPAPAGTTQALVLINKLPLAGSADVFADDVALLTAIGAQGPAGPTGATGPTGPTGPTGTTGPGATLFVSEQQGLAPSIPPGANALLIMDVEVTTTEENQRVKIDATIDTVVSVTGGSTNFEFGLVYNMFRIPGLVFQGNSTVNGSYERPSSGVGFYTWHSNFTRVDVPGPVGTYVYSITVTETTDRINIFSIVASNMGLTATVYPPDPGP